MREKYPYIMAILRGAFIAFAFLFVSSLTTLVVQIATVSAGSYFKDLKNYIIYIFCTVAAILIFNSFALAFAYSDRREVEEFTQRDNGEIRFFLEIKRIFKSPLLLTELITTHILIALLAALGAFPSLRGMFPFETPKGWFPALVLTPICFIISILAKYEASRFFKKLQLEGDVEKICGPAWLTIRIALICILYPLAIPLSPALVYAFITLFAVFAEISAILSVIGTILAAALLIFVIWGIKVLRGMSHRKKFLKLIKKTAEENGYIISDVKNPYRAFATSKNQCSFELELNGKFFSCIIISTLWKFVPLVFVSPNEAYFSHRIGTKDHGMELKHTIDFYHASSGSEKIVIVDPVPKKVFVSENNKTKRLYSADRIWKIGFHDQSSFLGCLERKCLDR